MATATCHNIGWKIYGRGSVKAPVALCAMVVGHGGPRSCIMTFASFAIVAQFPLSGTVDHREVYKMEGHS